MKMPLKQWLAWAGVFTALLFLAQNKHSTRQMNHYRAEIWGDKAGYYVYLPATFIYDWDGHKMPDRIEHKVGLGFTVDSASGKIMNKYPYGLALLQAPFFLGATIVSAAEGKPLDGFGYHYHRMINLAAVFYTVLGLMFLWNFLRRYFSRRVCFWALFLLVFATNMYWYVTDETGMSHIYSFFAFSILICCLQRLINKGFDDTRSIVYFSIAAGLIIAIRQINVIFIFTVLFFGIKNKDDFIERFKALLNWRWLAILPAIVLLFLIPQFIYYKYAFGSFLVYSYQGEHFVNKFEPEISRVLFSASYGLISHSPFFIFILIGMFLMLKNRKTNGILIFTYFLLITYIYAAWQSWSLGCGFGHRGYVEYYALFSIPLCYALQYIFMQKLWVKIPVALLIIGFMYVGFKMMYTFDGCFGGKDDWDWPAFTKLITEKK